MSFEKFIPEKKRTDIGKPPQAKVLKGGQISLNSSAYEQYLKGATHIELYYDTAQKKIGLQPKKYQTKSAFELRSVGKNKSIYRVNAKLLIEHYGLAPDPKIAITPSWNSSENLLELAL